jgi:hypothetical protein
MKCAKCDSEAVVGNYCADHAPGVSTMNRAERKGEDRRQEDRRQMETKQRDDDD